MFVVELSEMTKDFRTQEKFYANYKAMLFAKSPAAVDYYNKALSEGSFVVVSCGKLKVEQREHNGKVYVSLMMDNPHLDDAKFDDNAQPMQQQSPQRQQAPQPQRQPQQQQNYSPQQQQYAPQQQQAPQPQQGFNEPQQGFDDIPF